MATDRRSRVKKPRGGKSAAKRAKRARDALLAIDIGNTQTVLGIFLGDELAALWRISSGLARTGDEVGIVVGSLCREYHEALSQSRRISICSVVPALTEEYEAMGRRLYRARAFVVSDRVRTGVRLEIPDPSSLGADRIANAAAVATGSLPAIVVDLGTATTFDVIRAGGRYVGGVIAPGIRTSAEDLFRRAARLPKVEIRKPRKRIGRTTEESIQSGVYYAAVGAIDGIVRRLQSDLRRPARVVATGGLAPLIVEESETIREVDEALTLRGLLRLERLNR